MNGNGHPEETATSIIAISKLLSAKRINYYGWGDGSDGAPFQRVPSCPPNPLPLISLQSSSLSIIFIISVLGSARIRQRVEKESKKLNWSLSEIWKNLWPEQWLRIVGRDRSRESWPMTMRDGDHDHLHSFSQWSLVDMNGRSSEWWIELLYPRSNLRALLFW